MKSRRKKWVEHVAHVEKVKNAYKILVRKADHLEDLGIDGKIMSEWILGK
jgi:hypothetical protein